MHWFNCDDNKTATVCKEARHQLDSYNTLIMKILGIFITVTLLACHAAQGVPTDCAKSYQKLLQDLTTLRGNCLTAAFNDCCQVLHIAEMIS